MKHTGNLNWPGATRPPQLAWDHPALGGVRHLNFTAGVFIGGTTYHDLVKNRRVAATGSPTPTFVPASKIGPHVHAAQTSGFSLEWEVACNSNPLEPGQTAAAIIYIDANVGNKVIVKNNPFNGSTNTGINCYFDTTMSFVIGGSSGLSHSGISLLAGRSYFVVVSASAGLQNYVVRDLQTGQIFTSTQTTALTFSNTGANGHVQLLGDEFGDIINGGCAAVAYLPTFLSLEQQVAWAQDPYSLWYAKRRRARRFGILAGGTTFPQTITVVCTSAVALSRAVSHSLAVTCTSGVSVVKQVAHKLAVTCTSSVAAISAIKVKLQTITVTCTTSTAFGAKQIAKKLAVTCTSSVGVIKSIAHKMAVTCTSAVAVITVPFILGATAARRLVNLVIFRK